jgi:hypothetical protein
LKAQPELIEFKVQFNLNQDGTSFWTVGGNQRMEQPTFDTIMKYSGRIAILFKLNGVAIKKDGKFNAEWKVEQVLFKDPIENTGKCLIRKRRVRRERRPKKVVDNDVDVDVDNDVDNDVDEPDELDIDHLKEIPDKIVEHDFKKRLFLKF